MEKWATGVFTSVDGGLGAGLAAVRQLGVPTVQLHAPSSDYRAHTRAADVKAEFREADIAITVVFVGFAEDDYATIESVERTVGLAPPTMRSGRLQEVFSIADFAAELEVDAIGMHLGFISPERSSSAYRELLAATRDVCDHCAANQQFFHLETGQEPAHVLRRFIQDVGRENLKVNFDPANMILYGAGDPLVALDLVGEYVRSVHCKDATYARQPGQAWHEDAPLGTGDVNIEAILRKLHALGYAGPLTIEREYSPDQAADIGAALELLQRLRTRILQGE